LEASINESTRLSYFAGEAHGRSSFLGLLRIQFKKYATAITLAVDKKYGDQSIASKPAVVIISIVW
jgi:hypothetical protein